jgi:hypothetical protein
VPRLDLAAKLAPLVGAGGSATLEELGRLRDQVS